MRIAYFHGFGSKFDPNNPKVVALSKLGEVVGVDVDYTNYAADVVEIATMWVIKTSPDLIVGTSMGGWLAADVGTLCGVPFVAINPSIKPSLTLAKHPSHGIDYAGREYELPVEVVLSYSDITIGGFGLVIVDRGDDVIDSYETTLHMEPTHYILAFEGGSHRFDHIEESLGAIERFYNKAQVSYGS